MGAGIEWQDERGVNLFSSDNLFFRIHPLLVSIPTVKTSPLATVTMPSDFPDWLEKEKVFLITPNKADYVNIVWGSSEGAMVEKVEGRKITLRREYTSAWGGEYKRWSGYIGWLE